jgi:hypothetical protein
VIILAGVFLLEPALLFSAGRVASIPEIVGKEQLIPQ